MGSHGYEDVDVVSVACSTLHAPSQKMMIGETGKVKSAGRRYKKLNWSLSAQTHQVIFCHYFQKTSRFSTGCFGVGGYLTLHHDLSGEGECWWQICTECDMLLSEDYVAYAGGPLHIDS